MGLDKSLGHMRGTKKPNFVTVTYLNKHKDSFKKVWRAATLLWLITKYVTCYCFDFKIFNT